MVPQQHVQVLQHDDMCEPILNILHLVLIVADVSQSKTHTHTHHIYAYKDIYIYDIFYIRGIVSIYFPMLIDSSLFFYINSKLKSIFSKGPAPKSRFGALVKDVLSR